MAPIQPRKKNMMAAPTQSRTRTKCNCGIMFEAKIVLRATRRFESFGALPSLSASGNGQKFLLTHSMHVRSGGATDGVQHAVFVFSSVYEKLAFIFEWFVTLLQIYDLPYSRAIEN